MIDDFQHALEEYPDDPDIRLVCETLQISHHALLHDPNQIPAQVIGRSESPTPVSVTVIYFTWFCHFTEDVINEDFAIALKTFC